MKRMYDKILNLFPAIGGSLGGSIAAITAVTHDQLFTMLVSAAIFAIVGGALGYIVNVSMKWLGKKIKTYYEKLFSKTNK